MYEPQPEVYEHHPATAHMIRHGLLTLVRWDHRDSGYSMFTSTNKMYDKYDQNLAYNHMLLAFYKRNSYLLMVDSDEVCSI